MKINWFSPVGPAPTDIANFTQRVMPCLQKQLEVTVWTDTDDFDPGFLPGVEIRSCRDLDRAWPEINFADFSLYNIGNDARFHAHYAAMLERHPGIVILHDFNLHELHRERLIHAPSGQAAFSRYVLETGGVEAWKAVCDFQQGEISFEEAVERGPLIRSVTRHATGIVSFNEGMKAGLQRETNAPMLFCPLPLESIEAMPPVVERKLRPGQRLEVAMFGYLNSPNRRLDEVLQAVAGFEPGKLRLTLFGHIKDGEAFARRIRQLGIEDSVRLLGYLSEEEMGRVLQESHLAINLRNPTRGESSGALLRAWKYSLPVLVTNTGYYATVPESLVCRVDPGDEVEGVERHIRAFIDSPQDYIETGLRAHRYFLEHHSADCFAESLAAFLHKAEAYRKKSFVHDYARRIGQIVHRDLGGTRSEKALQERTALELVKWVQSDF
jgi:glycosyltransferase involved in cell wall biosynthesis